MAEPERLVKEDVERVLSEWFATHTTKQVTLHTGETVLVCVNCEWPPALDGRCRCDWEEKGTDL